jgi:hypothetical protein
VDQGDRDDQVEDLLEREILSNLMASLGGEQERSAGRHHPVAAFAHHRRISA